MQVFLLFTLPSSPLLSLKNLSQALTSILDVRKKCELLVEAAKQMITSENYQVVTIEEKQSVSLFLFFDVYIYLILFCFIYISRGIYDEGDIHSNEQGCGDWYRKLWRALVSKISFSPTFSLDKIMII